AARHRAGSSADASARAPRAPWARLSHGPGGADGCRSAAGRHRAGELGHAQTATAGMAGGAHGAKLETERAERAKLRLAAPVPLGPGGADAGSFRSGGPARLAASGAARRGRVRA